MPLITVQLSTYEALKEQAIGVLDEAESTYHDDQTVSFFILSATLKRLNKINSDTETAMRVLLNLSSHIN